MSQPSEHEKSPALYAELNNLSRSLKNGKPLAYYIHVIPYEG